MPRIEPVSLEAFDPELRELLAAAQASRAILDDTTTAQLWALRPELAKVQLPLHTAFHTSNTIDGRVLELARLRIALLNDCVACKAARKDDSITDEDLACLASDDPRFSELERAVLRFAELFAVDHQSIDDDVIRDLGRYLTPAQIVELTMYCGTMLAGGRFAHVMRGWAHDEEPVVVPAGAAVG